MRFQQHKLRRDVIIPLLVSAVALGVVVTLAQPDTVARAQPLIYQIRGVSGASGGGVSANDAYILSGTLGQGWTATSSGSGYRVVSGVWDRPASQSTTIYLPYVARSEWQIQPDDVPDTCPGYRIQLGQAYEEDMDHGNDNDWWAFEAEAGETYTIHTFNLGEQGDTVLALHDVSCGRPLAENDDCGGELESCLTWQAPATGEYHLMIRHYDWRVTGPETTYTVGVERGSTLSAPYARGRTSGDKPTAVPTPGGSGP